MQCNSISEATVSGVKFIAESCIKSKTVKKIIYTATVMAASPLKDDGSGYKETMDETCWTPLNLSYDMFPVRTFESQLIKVNINYYY